MKKKLTFSFFLLFFPATPTLNPQATTSPSFTRRARPSACPASSSTAWTSSRSARSRPRPSRARRGDGPTLIEAETYRFRGHSLADPDELRSKEEKEHYAKRDPIPAFKKYATARNLLSESDISEIEAAVLAEVDESVEFADASPKPDMSQLLENVFADPKGFGIAADGRYRYELPGFSSGTAEVS